MIPRPSPSRSVKFSVPRSLNGNSDRLRSSREKLTARRCGEWNVGPATARSPLVRASSAAATLLVLLFELRKCARSGNPSELGNSS